MKKMTDKEEKLARDALKYGFIFMLVVSIPIWLPIVALGTFLCFPLYLIYLLAVEFNEYKIDKNTKQEVPEQISDNFNDEDGNRNKKKK